jgi:hypothetical protein
MHAAVWSGWSWLTSVVLPVISIFGNKVPVELQLFFFIISAHVSHSRPRATAHLYSGKTRAGKKIFQSIFIECPLIAAQSSAVFSLRVSQ